MGDTKSKRRKKDTAAELAVPTAPPKVEIKKKARATDDVLPVTVNGGQSDALTNGHSSNGHTRDYSGNSTIAAIAEDERRRLIAEAAYFRAVRRNFVNGTPEADWLEAEAEVGAMLSQQRS